jgi:hypothetical protein
MEPSYRQQAAGARVAGTGLALTLLALLGCASGTREATRAVIDELSTERNVAKMREPAHSLAGAMTSGALESLGEAGRDAALRGLLDEYTRQFMTGISQQLDAELGPAVERQVRRSVAAVLDELTAEQRQAGLAQLTERITAAAMDGLGESLERQLQQRFSISDSIEHKLGPALARTMVKDIGPAAQSVLEDDLGPGLAHMMRGELGDAITDTVGNSAEAVGQRFAVGARREVSPVIDHFFDRLQGAMQEGRQGAESVFQVVMAVVLALSVGVLGVLLYFRHREAKARYDALHLVVREISRMSAVEPATLALVSQIKKSGEGSVGGETLSAFLRKHPSLKVRTEASSSP